MGCSSARRSSGEPHFRSGSCSAPRRPWRWRRAPSSLARGPLPPHVVGAIVFMAVAAILLAYLAQTRAQRFTSPVRTGLLFAVEPLAAVAFGVLWLGDSLSARQAVARPRSWAGWSWAK
ncbi:MAG TPA: DMT family transporter [bacterium]|nr:DMT family transporter [bacterium]